MYKIFIILLLIGQSIQSNDEKKLRSYNSSDLSGLSTEQNSREARSNHFLTNVFKNPDVQSHLKKTNPHLLQYFSNKENHVFNDIMRKFSNNDTNQNPNISKDPIDTNSSKDERIKELQYEVSTDFHDNNNYHGNISKKFIFGSDDSMHAHETQNTDQKDQITKLIPTSNDNKNNEKLSSISYKQGQYVPVENGNFHEYLSCCEQLFSRYGNKNYLHEDIYIIPRNDEFSHYSYPIHPHNSILFPKTVNQQRIYPMFDREGKIPFLNTVKDYTIKNKHADIECIENFHNVDGQIIHRIDPPAAFNGHLVMPIQHAPRTLGRHFLSVPSSGEHLVPVQSSGHSMSIHRASHLAPPMFHPSSPTPQMVLSRKLSLFGKKYFLG